MHNLLLHFSVHNGAVMMHHIPPSIVELEDISHIESPNIHIVDVRFHGNPSHVCKYPSPNIPYLKVDSLLPIEGKLPTMNYGTITAWETKMDKSQWSTNKIYTTMTMQIDIWWIFQTTENRLDQTGLQQDAFVK